MSKYFPLTVVDELQEGITSFAETLEGIMEMTTGNKTDMDFNSSDFPDYFFGVDFLYPFYMGKYEEINDFLLYNKDIHRMIMQGVPFSDVAQRKTEWRDLFGECYVLREWNKSKMVYKLDSDFFHEVKETTNLKFSCDMMSHLPFTTMYFDLSDVKEIGDFAGAWVHIHKVGDKRYMLAIYMVMRTDHAIFSYYCGFNFDTEDNLEVDVKNIVNNVAEEYFIRDYQIRDGEGKIIRHDLNKAEDYRSQIIIAICQILEFLHADIEDIDENSITKNTYKPSTTIKNKFSEVRMWDVGVRYGKAIRFAKEEMNKAIEDDAKECVLINKKTGKPRKPVRPHIRSAHWQRYHVGEGRQQIKINWIPPVYVCGTREIAVTIHKVGK